MAGNNFQSLLYCVFKNGQYVDYPFFQDASAQNIIYIRQLDIPDSTGTLVNGFYILTQDSKGVQNNVYYVVGYLNTLGQFQTELNALSTQNSFTLYTGLLRIDAFEVVGDLNGDIIINDLQSQDNRIYNVDRDETIVTVNNATNLIYTQIVLDGDQTNAGGYFYD